MIEAETKTKTTKQWLDVFEGSGLPYAAVNDIQATLNHEHGKYLDYITFPAATEISYLLTDTTPLQYLHATWSERSTTPRAAP